MKDFNEALSTARAMQHDTAGMSGHGVATLTRADGSVEHTPFTNLITTTGDQYYAKMGTALVGTPNTAQPTKVNGMKLGSSSTAPTKSGTAAAIVGTYASGSNVAFDSAFPQTSAVTGTDTGWYATYQGTWGAGVATGTINEVVIVTDQGTNATSTAANTIARAVVSTVTKAAGDTLTILWNHKLLGA